MGRTIRQRDARLGAWIILRIGRHPPLLTAAAIAEFMPARFGIENPKPSGFPEERLEGC